MKVIPVIILILLLFCPFCSYAAGSELETELNLEREKYDLSQWGDGGLLTEESASDITDEFIDGSNVLSGEKLLSSIAGGILDGIKQNCALIIACVASALLSGLSTALLRDDNTELKELTSFLVCALNLGLVAVAFSSAAGKASAALSELADFSQLATPTIALMLTASGGAVRSATFSTVMTFLSATVITFIQGVIMPVILAGGALATVSSLFSRARTDKLFALVKSSLKWLFGILTTVYFAVVTINGLGAAGSDALTVKTARYVIDKGVPAAGQLLSGSFDTVLACATVVRNASGLSAIIVALGRVIPVMIELICLLFSFKLCSALCAPVADSRVLKLLDSVSSMLTYLIAAVLITSAMFTVTMGILVCCILH